MHMDADAGRGEGRPPLGRNFLLAGLGGTAWYFQFFFYTMGESQMGRFGFSSWTTPSSSDSASPDAVIVRSFSLHEREIPDSVKAIGRAGAGVNNIPVPAMSARGIPVFNSPGANANAVKELVIEGLIIGCRHL